MAKKTRISEAIGAILQQEAPNTGKDTVNSPNPTKTGGISVAMDLLPDVKEGDVVTLKVVSVDPTKNEVHLERVEEAQETTPPPEMA